jgi:hypothetical protein
MEVCVCMCVRVRALRDGKLTGCCLCGRKQNSEGRGRTLVARYGAACCQPRVFAGLVW